MKIFLKFFDLPLPCPPSCDSAKRRGDKGLGENVFLEKFSSYNYACFCGEK